VWSQRIAHQPQLSLGEDRSVTDSVFHFTQSF
jgi:hypothetical protein